MKFDCGPTWQEKYQAKQVWHPFFTILPRRVGPRDCRWLETIERRGRADWYDGQLDYEYRARK